MTEQETVALLAGLLDARDPFLHVRFGDGDVFFATGTGPKLTGDGETWTPTLAAKLTAAWENLASFSGRLLVGDVESYAVSDGCEPQWRSLVAAAEAVRGGPLEFVHMEALRVSFGHALPFYVAAARDSRGKVFVGPERLHGAAELLGADHVPVPLETAHEQADTLARVVEYGHTRHRRWDVAYFAAGRGGKIMQAKLSVRCPLLTQVDVGSGLDILFTDLRRGTDGRADPLRLRHQYAAAGLNFA